MLGEHDLTTYEVRPEWYSLLAARRTFEHLSRAVSRGDVRLTTAIFPAGVYMNQFDLIERPFDETPLRIL